MGPSRRTAVAVWAATFATPLLLAAVALGAGLRPEAPQLRAVFLFLASAVAGLGILMARALPPRIGARPGAPAATAFVRSLAAWAILEGAALFPVVAFLVTGDAWLLLVAGAVLAVHASLFPGENRWRALGGPADGAGAPAGSPGPDAGGSSPGRRAG
jgi:hypothetical protein